MIVPGTGSSFPRSLGGSSSLSSNKACTSATAKNRFPAMTGLPAPVPGRATGLGNLPNRSEFRFNPQPSHRHRSRPGHWQRQQQSPSEFAFLPRPVHRFRFGLDHWLQSLSATAVNCVPATTGHRPGFRPAPEARQHQPWPLALLFRLDLPSQSWQSCVLYCSK